LNERVLKAIRSCKKNVSEISADTKLREDLDFNSLDMLMLISELEDEFNVNIDESHFDDIKTVGDIIEKFHGAGIC
jgi:acyl carrier protein